MIFFFLISSILINCIPYYNKNGFYLGNIELASTDYSHLLLVFNDPEVTYRNSWIKHIGDINGDGYGDLMFIKNINLTANNYALKMSFVSGSTLIIDSNFQLNLTSSNNLNFTYYLSPELEVRKDIVILGSEVLGDSNKFIFGNHHLYVDSDYLLSKGFLDPDQNDGSNLNFKSLNPDMTTDKNNHFYRIRSYGHTSLGNFSSLDHYDWISYSFNVSLTRFVFGSGNDINYHYLDYSESNDNLIPFLKNIGDINGDGIDDLFMIHCDTSTCSNLITKIYFGGIYYYNFLTDLNSFSLLRSINVNLNMLDFPGLTDVNKIRRFNDDIFDDFLIVESSRLTFVTGKKNISSIDLTNFDDSAGIAYFQSGNVGSNIHIGGRPYTNVIFSFNRKPSNPGDLNGDGLSDFALKVAVTSEGNQILEESGVILIIFGITSLPLHTSSTSGNTLSEFVFSSIVGTESVRLETEIEISIRSLNNTLFQDLIISCVYNRDDKSKSCVFVVSANSISCDDSSRSCSCPSGTYLKAAEDTVCSRCDGRTVVNDTQTKCRYCPAGLFYNSNTEECEECGQNEVSTIDSTSCTACEDSLGANIQHEQCVSCWKGTYYAGLNEGCLSCANSTISNIENAQSCTSCSSTTFPNYAKTECISCSPGTYYDFNSDSCIQCAEGTYTSTSGQTSCATCLTGQQVNEFRSGCVVCEAGTYFNATTNTCELCAAGTFTEDLGETSCTTCTSGSVSNEQRTACVQCAAGTYSNNNSCLECPEGTYNLGVGNDKCLECPEVYITSSLTGVCEPCESGSIPNVEKTDCVPCSEGYYARSGIDDECLKCKSGYEVNEDLDGCISIL